MQSQSLSGKNVVGDHGVNYTNNPERAEVRTGKMYYRNGCSKHTDCFTCPFPDCTWSYYKEVRNKQRRK